MRADHESSTKNSRSPKKGQRLNTTKESSIDTRASCNPKSLKIHFIISPITQCNQTKVFLSTWFLNLTLDECIDNIEAKNCLKAKQGNLTQVIKSKIKVTQAKNCIDDSSYQIYLMGYILLVRCICHNKLNSLIKFLDLKKH